MIWFCVSYRKAPRTDSLMDKCFSFLDDYDDNEIREAVRLFYGSWLKRYLEAGKPYGNTVEGMTQWMRFRGTARVN